MVAPSSALSGRLHGALRFAASPVGLCFVQGAWPGWAHRPAQCGQAWAKPGPARAELAWGSKGSTTCSSGQSRAWGWMGWAGLAGGGASPLCSERVCGRSAWLRVGAPAWVRHSWLVLLFPLEPPMSPFSFFPPSLSFCPPSIASPSSSVDRPSFPLPSPHFYLRFSHHSHSLENNWNYFARFTGNPFIPSGFHLLRLLFILSFIFCPGPCVFSAPLQRTPIPQHHPTARRTPSCSNPFRSGRHSFAKTYFFRIFLFIHSFSTHHYHHYHHYPLGISPNCGSSCASTATDLGQPPLRSPHSINHTPPSPSAGCVPAIGVWDQGKDNIHFNTDDTPITNKSTRPKWRPT